MYPQLKNLYEKENKDDNNKQNILTPSSQSMKKIETTNSK